MTKVTRGLQNATKELITEPDGLIKLWIHEFERIYADKMSSKEDEKLYRELKFFVCSKAFAKFNMKKYLRNSPELLVFGDLNARQGNKEYGIFPSIEVLRTKLYDSLAQYNKSNL